MTAAQGHRFSGAFKTNPRLYQSTAYDINDFVKPLQDYGKYNGATYGLDLSTEPFLLWYRTDIYNKLGLKIPTTWDEQKALMDQIVKDGDTPWCVGIESGTATGWPATDWVENIMLRTTSPENYDKWVQGTLPFTGASVVAMVILAGFALLLGGLAMWVARTRRSAQPDRH